MKEFHKRYGPFYPAALTALGAVVVACSLSLAVSKEAIEQEISNFGRLAGALIAAAGALWSGVRQVRAVADNRARDAKLLELSEKIRGEVTGGDGFCSAIVSNLKQPQASWMFHNRGEFTLYELQVRIFDVERGHEVHRFDIGNVAAGFVSSYQLPNQAPPTASVRAYNLFFTARNGAWVQELRVIQSPRYYQASRVTRNSDYASPLALEIPDGYPGELPLDAPWNQFPADIAMAALAAVAEQAQVGQ